MLVCLIRESQTDGKTSLLRICIVYTQDMTKLWTWPVVSDGDFKCNTENKYVLNKYLFTVCQCLDSKNDNAWISQLIQKTHSQILKEDIVISDLTSLHLESLLQFNLIVCFSLLC